MVIHTESHIVHNATLEVSGCKFYTSTITVSIHTWLEARTIIERKWSWDEFRYEKTGRKEYYIHQNDPLMKDPYWDNEYATNKMLDITAKQEWTKMEQYCVENFKILPKNAR